MAPTRRRNLQAQVEICGKANETCNKVKAIIVCTAQEQAAVNAALGELVDGADGHRGRPGPSGPAPLAVAR